MSRRALSPRKLALLSLLIVCAVLAEQIIVTVNGVDVHEKKLSMSAIVARHNSPGRAPHYRRAEKINRNSGDARDRIAAVSSGVGRRSRWPTRGFSSFPNTG